MEKKLKVSHVRIQNVLGIAELEFAPGGFTEISGANGSGKTSTIEALRAKLQIAPRLRQGFGQADAGTGNFLAAAGVCVDRRFGQRRAAAGLQDAIGGGHLIAREALRQQDCCLHFGDGALAFGIGSCAGLDGCDGAALRKRIQGGGGYGLFCDFVH